MIVIENLIMFFLKKTYLEAKYDFSLSYHIYHTIFHGYNAMGPHSSFVSDDERWKIVLYVNELKNQEE